jgi:micrococcal nuclease
MFAILVTSSVLAQRQKVTIQKVIDAQTLEVVINKKKEKLHLLGVELPVLEKKSATTKIKKEAKAFVDKLIKPKQAIELEFDIEHRDRFKYLQAYVFLKDEKMLNEEIIKAGFSKVSTGATNLRYAKRLEEAQKFASEQQTGLWKY